LAVRLLLAYRVAVGQHRDEVPAGAQRRREQREELRPLVQKAVDVQPYAHQASLLNLAEYEIDGPAPTDVHCRSVAAVGEDIVAVAPGVLKCVGENGHSAEVARLVHLACQ
jgi:hypothetical protein